MIKLSEYLPKLTRMSDAQRAELIGRSKGGQINYFLEDKYAQWYVHDGDLLIPGDVCSDINLIVMGDFIVHGCYDDYASLGTGSIACYGNMWAENVFSWGSIYVEGNLYVDGLLHTVYNDFTFEVLGTVYARVAIIDDKSTNEPKYDCDVLVDDHLLSSEDLERAVKKCKKLLPPLCWDAESDDDNERLPEFNRTRAHYFQGEQLFSKPRKISTSGSELDKIGRQLSVKNAGVEQLRSIAKIEDHKFRVATHPACPTDLLADFAKDKDERIRWATASHPSTPAEILDLLSRDLSESVKRAVTHREVEREEVSIVLPTLDDYREDDERARQQTHQGDPEPDFAELERILAGPASDRMKVAKAAIGSEGLFETYHKVRDQVLERLMLDSSEQVREIASCAWLRQKFYEKHEQALLTDKVSDIRFVLALRTRNAKTLQRLMSDESFEVRCAVLMNPNTPEESLKAAADSINPSNESDEVVEIMGGLMQNMLLPPQMISLLYKKLPAGMLARHCNSPIEVVAAQMSLELESKNPNLARKITECKSPEELFTLFARSNIIELQRAAAINCHSPHAVIMELHSKSADNEPMRWTIAANPSLPEKLYKEFATDTARVRVNLASNPSCPIEILRTLAKTDDIPVVRQSARLNLQKMHGEDTD